MRRFYCRNPSCPRRTFAEPLPDLVRPRARRTRRLSQAQSRIGVALGGEGGAWASPGFLIPSTRPKLIKRQSYGRAGLDLLRRRMILAA